MKSLKISAVAKGEEDQMMRMRGKLRVWPTKQMTRCQSVGLPSDVCHGLRGCQSLGVLENDMAHLDRERLGLFKLDQQDGLLVVRRHQRKPAKLQSTG